MTKSKIKISNLYIFFLLFLIILLVISPKNAMQSFFLGLNIWATKVLPALLPFFILTKLLSYTQFVNSFGKILSPVTKKLYGVGGNAGYVFVMSIISGYPVGAKLLSDLYTDQKITQKQAIAITSFTSTSGPLFILGTVSIGLFDSRSMGIIVLISHLLGSLINGLFYRIKQDNAEYSIHTQSTSNFLNDSMTSSITSIMTVGGFIAIFYMGLQLMIACHIFDPIVYAFDLIGLDSNLTLSIISGLIEVTTGAIMLSPLSLNPTILTAILTFLISFGGLSIHAQAYCFLKNFHMPYKLFLLQKTTQAITSTILAVIICIFI